MTTNRANVTISVRGENMSASESKLPRVCLLASAETSPSVLYGLFDVLSTVGAIYPEMTTGEAGAQLLDVKIVATASKPFRCYGNVMVEPDVAVDDLAETDVAIVCDMYQPIDAPPRGRYRCEIDWIKRMYAGGAIVASVCSGSIILAESGILDGFEAAGHWAYREMFRDHYPKGKTAGKRDSLPCGRAGPDRDGRRRRLLARIGGISYHPALRSRAGTSNH